LRRQYPRCRECFESVRRLSSRHDTIR
jgi:hypothetical protein